MADLTEDQIERYSRNILLKELGGRGQEKLLQSRVLIIGVGGLGSPAALYLAAAGVGAVGLVDPEEVELSNLQRQVIHHTLDVGASKVESAASKMRAINPDIAVDAIRETAAAGNIVELMKEYDFVIDATDSLEAKFLVNDGAFFAGKPYSHAGVLRFSGQTMTVLPGETACYRCLFPEPPLAGEVRPCSEAGVLGTVPGVMGTIQATEAIKFILGTGNLLTNALLIYDALKMTFRRVKVKKSPDCPLCGENATISRP